MKKVCVLGLGSLGYEITINVLQAGWYVIAYVQDAARVLELNSEDDRESNAPHAAGLFAGKFRAQTTVPEAHYFIITESLNQETTAEYVALLAPVLKKNNALIIASVVSCGTTQRFAALLQEATGLVAGKDLYIAYCPYQNNDRRCLIGGINQASSDVVELLYEQWVSVPVQKFSAASVEVALLAAQAATLVERTMTQELIALAHASHVDPYELMTLVKEEVEAMMPPRCGVDDAPRADECQLLFERFPGETTFFKSAAARDKQRVKKIVTDIVAAARVVAQSPCKILFLGFQVPESADLQQPNCWSIIKNCMKQRGIEVKICDPHHADTQVLSSMPPLIELAAGLLWADIVVCLASNVWLRAHVDDIAQHPYVIDTCGLLYHNPYQLSEFLAAEPLDPEDLFEEMLQTFTDAQ